MIDPELISHATDTLKSQKARSILTLLGIVIGVAAVVALLSAGEGLRLAVEKQFETLGSTTIMIVPGGSFVESVFTKLQEDDAETISDLKGVDYATPIYMATKTVSFGEKSKSIIIIGIDSKTREMFGESGIMELSSGRVLFENDRYSVLIGEKLAKDSFDSEIKTKQKINVNGYDFRVIGTAKPVGTGIGSFFNAAVIMNADSLKEINGKDITPFRITAKATSKNEIEAVKDRITRALEKKHGKKDFMIQDQQQVMERANSVISIIQAVLTGIAAISLFVGGLGIMNTMFMAITERTKEIGVMKAVGATNNRILGIFLAESALIGLLGGIAGTILGFALSTIISIAATAYGFEMQTYFGSELAIGAILFSMAIGILSGFIPAMMAASLQPIDALKDN